MSTHLLHRDGGTRALPIPGPRLYRGSAVADAGCIGASLLALGDPEGMTRWQRWRSSGPRRNEAVRHVLYLHRCAFDAELAGHFASADFFWREAIAALRATWHAEAAWAAVADAVHANAGSLREVVAAELFIDSHIAFANGYLRVGAPAPAPENRAFVHAAFIGRLLELPALEADFATVLLPAVIAEVEALKSSKQIDSAIDRLRRERQTPSTPVLSDMLAALLFGRTMDALAKNPEGRELADARRIERGIRDLEEVRQAHPENLAVYDLLAQLHHLHSIRLNNGSRVSAALLASAKAAAYRPGFEAAEAAKQQLLENMQQLQQQAAKVQAELRGVHNKQLSAKGMALVQDAKAGLAPMRAFEASGEAGRIPERRRIADAARLWRHLDGGTGARPADAQLMRLREAVIELRGAPECDAAGLVEAIAAMPGLPPVDAHAVARRVLELRGQAVEPEDAGGQPIAHAIAPAQATPERGEILERLGHWLLGRQDRGTKAFAAAASAIFVAMLATSAIDLPRQQVRDAALAQIRASDPARDYERVISASERFLGAKASLWNDPRKDEVLDAYARAFTSWFANVEAPGDPMTRQRVALYRTLTQQGEQR